MPNLLYTMILGPQVLIVAQGRPARDLKMQSALVCHRFPGAVITSPRAGS
jgi:hypothetical protein